MGSKLIFVLLCVPSCLNYPIDDQANVMYETKFEPKIANDFSADNRHAQMMGNFAPKSLPNLPISHLEYIDRQRMPEMGLFPLPSGLEYSNNAESNIPTFFTGHRPVGKPPRPQPEPPIQIPDDVEVFGPPQPYPPARPIPMGPNFEGDFEPLWPASGKPIPFPKNDFIGLGEGNMEILPILIDKGGFLGSPMSAENKIPTIYEPVRNERPVMNEGNGPTLPSMPVMIENQNPIIFAQEPPQMMPVLVRNDPVGTIPAIFEPIKRPAMMETEHPKMMFFDENKQNVPMGMENEMTFMSQARAFTDDEKVEKNPSEFTQIPLELPERFKRGDEFVNADSEPVVLLQEKEFDRIKQNLVFDNEIPNDEQIKNDVKLVEENYTDSISTEKLVTSNESVLNSEDKTLSTTDDSTSTPVPIDETLDLSTTDDISPTTTPTVNDTKEPAFEIEHMPVTSIIPTINEPNEEIATPRTSSNKLSNNGNLPVVKKVLVEEPKKNDQVQNLNISNTLQPSTNKNEEIIATTSTSSTSDAKIENSNSNLDQSEKIINNEQKDKIQLIIPPTEIPFTKPSSTENNLTEIKIELKKYLMQLLEDMWKNKKEQSTPSPLDNHFIDLPQTYQPSGQLDATENTHLTQMQTGNIQYEAMYPHLSYLPVHSQKLEHDMNGFTQSFGNLHPEVFNLQHEVGNMEGSGGLLSLSQTYPSFNNFHYQVPQFRHY